MSRELQIKWLQGKHGSLILRALFFAVLLLGLFMAATSYEQQINSRNKEINQKADTSPVTKESEGMTEGISSDKSLEQPVDPLVDDTRPEGNTQSIDTTQESSANAKRQNTQAPANPSAQNNAASSSNERQSNTRAEQKAKPRPPVLCMMGICL